MPCLTTRTMDHFFCAVALPMWTMWSPASVQNNHIAAPVSGTFRTLPPEPTPARAGTLRNLPQPSRTFQYLPEPSGTLRNLPKLASWNLHQHTPELAGTLRPPEPSATGLRNLHQRQNSLELSGTLRNSPEPASAWNLHQHTPEPSGTSGTSLRNLLLRLAPAHTGACLGWRPHYLMLWGKSNYSAFSVANFRKNQPKVRIKG